MKRSLSHFLIRTFSFIDKEFFETLRQPRLVLTLVFGPFLILLLFGVGFQGQARALRTLFVVPKESFLADQVEKLAPSLGPQLIFAGITHDSAEAKLKLLRGETDLVVVIPPNAEETIKQNQQITLSLYHDEIDPFQVDYVRYFGEVYVGEVNRRVLQTVTEESQHEAGTISDTLEEARVSAKSMREALETGDTVQAHRHQDTLARDVDALSLAMGASVGALALQQPNTKNEVVSRVNTLQQDIQAIGAIEEDRRTYREQVRQVEEIENDLSTLESRLAEFQDLSPTVVVSPFRTQIENVKGISVKVSDYFAPAVIVLLLQHLAVTFAALSIMRERQIGTFELFNVSPISAVQILIGKYFSYFIFGTFIALSLTLLVRFGLQVPMHGTWASYSLVVAALLFTSLGIGFVLALLAKTDSQAVQYSMMVLLGSVFFSGFFISLELLWAPVRVLAWVLPATYGIVLLQNIMLKGFLADFVLMVGLTLMGAAFFGAAWLLLRRQIASAL